MISEHSRIGKMSLKEFSEKIEKCKGNIETTAHTFFRLSEKQRKVYDEKVLKDLLLNKNPLEIWEQENNHLAAFYDFENKRILKIILRFSSNKVYIVTFYILNKEQMKDFEK
jgi:hypothetical protein